jgi:ABC-type Mn2+/Zn2+ transport system permease subunit
LTVAMPSVSIAPASAAGVAGSAFGLILSYHLDVPTGAAMTLALGGVFAVCLLLRGMRRESR